MSKITLDHDGGIEVEFEFHAEDECGSGRKFDAYVEVETITSEGKDVTDDYTTPEKDTIAGIIFDKYTTVDFDEMAYADSLEYDDYHSY